MIIKVGPYGTIRLSPEAGAKPSAILEMLVAIKNELSDGVPSMSDEEFRLLLIDNNDYFKS